MSGFKQARLDAALNVACDASIISQAFDLLFELELNLRHGIVLSPEELLDRVQAVVGSGE